MPDANSPEIREVQPVLPVIEGYPYPPFSLLHDPELAKIHDLARSHPQPDNNLEVACMLFSLTGYVAEGTRKQQAQALNGPNGPFYAFGDKTPLIRPAKVEKLPSTTALLTYTAAKLEHLLRLQAVRTQEGTDNGISRMLASTLGRLSNAYRTRYELCGAEPHVLLVAHDLSQYARRYEQPDFHGYSQTVGHWLHLNTDVILPWHKNRYPEYEERLRLALALEELGPGPQDYAQFVARDLGTLYSYLGREHEAQALKTHFSAVPHERQEPEIWFEEHRTITQGVRRRQK